MKTLVLGGTGFVGRRLVEILIADGGGVTVVNRGVTPVELPPGVTRPVADRSDATSMRALLARHGAGGFPATIARPAAIYGPYNNIYDMEAAMFRRLAERRPVLLPYHGLVVGSYGHVDDLCRALLAMATHPAAVGEVFNVTTSAVTSAAYVATLAEVVAVEPGIVLLPDDLARTAARPLWGRTFDFAYEAEVAALARAR